MLAAKRARGYVVRAVCCVLRATVWLIEVSDFRCSEKDDFD